MAKSNFPLSLSLSVSPSLFLFLSLFFPHVQYQNNVLSYTRHTCVSIIKYFLKKTNYLAQQCWQRVFFPHVMWLKWTSHYLMSRNLLFFQLASVLIFVQLPNALELLSAIRKNIFFFLFYFFSVIFALIIWCYISKMLKFIDPSIKATLCLACSSCYMLISRMLWQTACSILLAFTSCMFACWMITFNTFFPVLCLQFLYLLIFSESSNCSFNMCYDSPSCI